MSIVVGEDPSTAGEELAPRLSTFSTNSTRADNQVLIMMKFHSVALLLATGSAAAFSPPSAFGVSRQSKTAVNLIPGTSVFVFGKTNKLLTL